MEDKESLEDKIEEKEILEFDVDLKPSNPYNKEVARQKGLRYDRYSKVYRDLEGLPVRDKYGNVLG
jgi:hypothetical protein